MYCPAGRSSSVSAGELKPSLFLKSRLFTSSPRGPVSDHTRLASALSVSNTSRAGLVRVNVYAVDWPGRSTLPETVSPTANAPVAVCRGTIRRL